MRLIRDKSELKSTCYIEFLPGVYRGKCWNEASVFLDESDFFKLKLIFEQRCPAFDYFAFTTIDAETWRRIAADLRVLAAVDQELGPAAGELADWVQQQLESHDTITVLGM